MNEKYIYQLSSYLRNLCLWRRHMHIVLVKAETLFPGLVGFTDTAALGYTRNTAVYAHSIYSHSPPKPITKPKVIPNTNPALYAFALRCFAFAYADFFA